MASNKGDLDRNDPCWKVNTEILLRPLQAMCHFSVFKSYLLLFILYLPFAGAANLLQMSKC